MAKRKKLSEEEQKQQLLKFRIEDLESRLNFIPEPTYKFEAGDKVIVGNLGDPTITEVLFEGKGYLVHYTTSSREKGIYEDDNVFTWLEVRKYNNTELQVGKDNEHRIHFNSSSLSSLFSKVYSFGVEFDVEYQRDYVWDIEDKIKLLESVFNGKDIGKFIFVKLPFTPNGASYEVLDGKQRLSTLCEFYEDRLEYKGLKYSELHARDKYRFKDLGIQYAELDNFSKEDVLKVFIDVNDTGRVMDKEHLDKVKQLLESALK